MFSIHKRFTKILFARKYCREAFCETWEWIPPALIVTTQSENISIIPFWEASKLCVNNVSTQGIPTIWKNFTIFSSTEGSLAESFVLFFFHLNIAVCLPRNVFPFACSEWWKLLESFPSIVLTKNRQKSRKVKFCWNLFEMLKCVCMYQAHKLMYLTCDFSSDIESKFYLVRNHIFLHSNHSIWIKQNDKKFSSLKLI